MFFQFVGLFKGKDRKTALIRMAGKIIKDACEDKDIDKEFLDDLLASLLDTARSSLMGKAEEALEDLTGTDPDFQSTLDGV